MASKWEEFDTTMQSSDSSSDEENPNPNSINTNKKSPADNVELASSSLYNASSDIHGSNTRRPSSSVADRRVSDSRSSVENCRDHRSSKDGGHRRHSRPAEEVRRNRGRRGSRSRRSRRRRRRSASSGSSSECSSHSSDSNSSSKDVSPKYRSKSSSKTTHNSSKPSCSNSQSTSKRHSPECSNTRNVDKYHHRHHDKDDKSHHRRRKEQRSHRRPRSRGHSRSPRSRGHSRSPRSRGHSRSPHRSHRRSSPHRRNRSPRHSRKRSFSPAMHTGIGRNVMAPQYEDSYHNSSSTRKESSPDDRHDRQLIRRELRLEKLMRLTAPPADRNILMAKQLAAGTSGIDLDTVRKIVTENDKTNPLYTMIMKSIGVVYTPHPVGSLPYIEEIIKKVKLQSGTLKINDLPNMKNPTLAVQSAKLELKKKLLWGKKDKVENKDSKTWGSTEFNEDVNSNKKEKFRKLMGICKNDSDNNTNNTKEENVIGNEQLKKQDEIFDIQAKNYDNARIATHIARGVGLGFAPQ